MTDITEQRVLVTGGCGFIGANFIHFIRRAWPRARIVNLDSLTYAGSLASLKGIEEGERYRFVHGDIRDGELLGSLCAQEHFTHIVHFAAESHVDRSIVGPDEFINTNIHGTFRLLEAARMMWNDSPDAHRDVRFLHISTDEVYGSLGKTGAFHEETPYNPRSPYSASKAASDHLSSAYYHTYGVPVIITNCSNNYGPFQFPEKLIPLMFLHALEGKSLPVYGDGGNVRDWLYVEDHCRALCRVLERGRPGRSYNIGGNSEKTNLEVVTLICDLLDEQVGPLASGEPRRSLISFVTDRPGHDRRYAIDASRIRDELGWQPAVDFEAGMKLTIKWYLTNTEWLATMRDGSYRIDHGR
jgi:dTDP-glucose 4,6-dehydratase